MANHFDWTVQFQVDTPKTSQNNRCQVIQTDSKAARSWHTLNLSLSCCVSFSKSKDSEGIWSALQSQMELGVVFRLTYIDFATQPAALYKKRIMAWCGVSSSGEVQLALAVCRKQRGERSNAANINVPFPKFEKLWTMLCWVVHLNAPLPFSAFTTLLCRTLGFLRLQWLATETAAMRQERMTAWCGVLPSGQMQLELAGSNKQLERRTDCQANCQASVHRPARPTHNWSGMRHARATVSIRPTARKWWNAKGMRKGIFIACMDGGSHVKSDFSHHPLHDQVHVLAIIHLCMGCSLLS